MAVPVFRGDRWRWGPGGWGGFIPHAGPGQGLWPSAASRWIQVWLVAAGERCVSSRPATSTGTPRRISPDDHPYRARWHVSSLLHAADRAAADQGSDRRNAAAFTGEGRGVVHVLPDDEAVARCRAALESAGIGVADEREPGARPHGGRLVGRGTGPAAARAAGGQRAQSDVLAGRRPHAAGPGMRHGGSTCSSREGRRPAPGRRGSAWTTAGCATGARRWKACPPRALPGPPSPRLTFAGRRRGDKAPDVLIEALALIDAPAPACLVGDGPLRGALTRLIRARGLEAVVHLPGWSHERARYIAQATVHVVPSGEESWSQSAVLAPGARRPGRRHRGRRPGAHPGRGPRRPGPARGPPRPRRGAVTRPGRRAPRPRPRPGLRPAVHPQRSGRGIRQRLPPAARQPRQSREARRAMA